MYNACIVGCGAIFQNHAESLSLIDCANLYAVCDNDKKSAAAKEYPVEKIYYDFEDVLKDENIDVVHICTPHYLHYEMIDKSLKAGKKVIAEKPMTMTKEQFDKLLNDHKDGHLYPILQNRKNKCIEEIKKIVGEETGKLLSVRGMMTWLRDADYYAQDEWRGKKTTEGGGVLINQSVHTLDIMNYFAGEADNVCATMSNKSLKGVIEVEDTCDAVINYKNGVKGIFFATNGYNTCVPMNIELIYEKTTFNYCYNKLYRDGELIAVDDSGAVGKTSWGAGHKINIEMIYNAIKNNTKSEFNFESTINTMKTMFAIYESASKNGEYVDVR